MRTSCYLVVTDTDFYCWAQDGGDYPHEQEDDHCIWPAHVYVLHCDIISARSKSIIGKLSSEHANIISYWWNMKLFSSLLYFIITSAHMEHDMQECLHSTLQNFEHNICIVWMIFPCNWAKYMQNIKDIIPSFLWQIIKNDWHGPRKCARIYRQTRTCGTRMHVHGLQDAKIPFWSKIQNSQTMVKKVSCCAYLLVHLTGKIAFHQNV